MILAVTGHRPEKLGGFCPTLHCKLVLRAETVLLDLKPDVVLVGMALGWDQGFAQACVNRGIPFKACVPFRGQANHWPIPSRTYYHELLAKAYEAIIVHAGPYYPGVMQKRNVYMVDNSTRLAAFWDGSRGGTFNCVAYARRVGRDITYYQPNPDRW